MMEIKRRSGGAPLFWLLVVAIALMAGVLTWVALPAPKAPAAAIVTSPSAPTPPVQQRRQLPGGGLTTVARAEGGATSMPVTPTRHHSGIQASHVVT
jgi:cytoskeletal protein RodZ